jgi:hypothetical protein
MSWGTTRAPEYASKSSSVEASQKATQLQAVGTLMLKDAHNRSEVKAAQEVIAEANNQLTLATMGIEAENERREETDMRTATLLGYDSWWTEVNGAMSGSALGYRKADMLNELEEDRYFVVLTAFDYQKLVKEKKQKFLWEVRFSIREHGTAFDDRIKGMAELASDYFGRNSGGLRHDTLPDGHVEIGPVKSLGEVPGK